MESHTRRRIFCFPVLLILLIAHGAVSHTRAHGLAWQSAPTARFEWSVPERFGPKDSDGLVDYHWNPATQTYSSEFINPKSWPVNFDACTSSDAASIKSYTWEIQGESIVRQSCKFTYDKFTVLGKYSIKLTVTTHDGQTSSLQKEINVKDILIVSIGDSFASGQGNPDIPKTGSKPARWIDKPCARSADAGPAQAAKSIEQADSHTSVTFISFACTGAEITAGLIGRQVRGSLTLDPQIDKVKEAISKRGRVDALIVSVGGNDAGFAELVARCIIQIDCSTDQGTQTKLQKGFDTLQPRYLQLNDKIKALQPITITKVFITEYGDLVRNEKGELCNLAPPFDLLSGIIRREARWASEVVIRGLNDRVKLAADTHGWAYVGGIADGFLRHGYCSKERWVRTFNEAKRVQGTDNKCTTQSFTSFEGIKDCIISSGSVHPTKGGHAWYATRIIEELQKAGVTTPVAP